MKAAFIFSGQGAQAVGMGKDLYDSSAAAKAVFDEADSVLGWSISEICFDGPAGKLTESRYCQPAIYTVSAACLAAFRETRGDVAPVGCAGLSLGEFAALLGSGVFSFADGLRLVARRGELMDAACRATDGGMASVLGGDPELVAEACAVNGIDMANYNCPGQLVISGGAERVKAAVAWLKERGLRKVIPLKVAGAYHSRLMADAGENLAPVLAEVPMTAPAIPVAQNFTGGFTDSIDEIKSNLVKQVAGSVRWEECVRTLITAGADTFIEFGPGKVLTGLVKRIDAGKAVFNISGVDGLGGGAE